LNSEYHRRLLGISYFIFNLSYFPKAVFGEEIKVLSLGLMAVFGYGVGIKQGKAIIRYFQDFQRAG
jgi:hypothetical protein